LSAPVSALIRTAPSGTGILLTADRYRRAAIGQGVRSAAPSDEREGGIVPSRSSERHREVWKGTASRLMRSVATGRITHRPDDQRPWPPFKAPGFRSFVHYPKAHRYRLRSAGSDHASRHGMAATLG